MCPSHWLRGWRALLAAGALIIVSPSALWLAAEPAGVRPAESSCPPVFQKLPPLGAPTPRELVKKFLTGAIRGDKDKVLSCFDLRTTQSLATAILFGDAVESAARTHKLVAAAQERFGQSGVDALRGELGIEFKEALPSEEKLADYLSRINLVTQGDTSVALTPIPAGQGDSLRMHKLDGRWYVTSAPEVSPLGASFAASVLESMGRVLSKAEEAASTSQSLEQFRQKLRQLSRENKIAPALSAAPSVERRSAPETVKPLATGHFRAVARNEIDPSMANALLVDLEIETPEPAEVELMFLSAHGGGGDIHTTEKHAGRDLASLRLRILIDYLEGSKERFEGNYLKVVVMRPDHGSSTQYYQAPSTRFLQGLRLPLKEGTYRYSGRNQSDENGVEVLSIGEYRLLLRVYEPKIKE